MNPLPKLLEEISREHPDIVPNSRFVLFTDIWSAVNKFSQEEDKDILKRMGNKCNANAGYSAPYNRPIFVPIIEPKGSYLTKMFCHAYAQLDSGLIVDKHIAKDSGLNWNPYSGKVHLIGERKLF